MAKTQVLDRRSTNSGSKVPSSIFRCTSRTSRNHFLDATFSHALNHQPMIQTPKNFPLLSGFHDWGMGHQPTRRLLKQLELSQAIAMKKYSSYIHAYNPL
ncbi:uncharacterized protein LOC132638485 isoform X2 [Lycium barbarum]|uniref:uncharacterized protein LOC132638485 isoform X2 n=1 Tax=Lycium barbarum TaxID=112863 RepID=UPI00293EF381|nr:uncharacterized protein LOC132638485 isoform X2 [Lycium barbarum]